MGKELPKKLLLDLEEWLPDECTYQMVLIAELHSRDAHNLFEYFLKKHFYKRLVLAKNFWWHIAEHSKNIVKLADNPLAVHMQEMGLARVFGRRSLSAITGHTYFEAKLLRKNNAEMEFSIDIGLCTPFGKYTDPKNGLLYNLYCGRHFDCTFSTFSKYADKKRKRKLMGNIFINMHLPGIGEGDVFGCGFSEPPPPLRIWRPKRGHFGPTILFTYNGTIIQRLRLARSIDWTHLHPFLKLSSGDTIVEANFGQKPFCYPIEDLHASRQRPELFPSAAMEIQNGQLAAILKAFSIWHSASSAENCQKSNLHIFDNFVCQFWNAQRIKWLGNIFIKVHLPGIGEDDVFGCGFLDPPPPIRIQGPKKGHFGRQFCSLIMAQLNK